VDERLSTGLESTFAIHPSPAGKLSAAASCCRAMSILRAISYRLLLLPRGVKQ
jgi:hypothetical protein